MKTGPSAFTESAERPSPSPSSRSEGGAIRFARSRQLGWAVLLGLFAIALVARAGWGLWRESRSPQPAALEFPDEVQYWNMAVSLHDGNGLRDELGFRATRMPLYPAFLSLFAGWEHGALAAKSAQWAVGALVAPLTALLAHAFFSRRVALLAGLWCAVDPFLVFFASLLLTETISITVLCALWWIIARTHREERSTVPSPAFSRWLSIAGLAALCVYSRESTIGLAIVGMLFLALLTRSRARNVAACALAITSVVLTLVPWGVRNARVTGEWCWLTTRTGISLYDGVGPSATGASDLADVKQSPEVRSLGEHAWNRYFLSESLRIIREDPARVARLSLAKIARMWNPFPNVSTHQSRLERWVSAAWTLPTLGFAACGAVLLVGYRCRSMDGVHADSELQLATGREPLVGKPPVAPVSRPLQVKEDRGAKLYALVLLLLPAVYFSALHALFVGSVRYRLAAMPMIEVLAAFAVVALVERVLGSNAAARGTCAT